MKDQFDRQVTYLRLSVTDRCNFACTYCSIRNDGDDYIQPAEAERLFGVLASRLGFRKVRLTGGEPLVRSDIDAFVAAAAGTEGIEVVGLTTNGSLLDVWAERLFAAGLRHVNVSVDSLKPGLFREITRSGKLDRVLDGIRAARAVGMTVKVNCVLLEGVNDAEIGDFADFAATEGIGVRFIEVMPTDERARGRAVVPADAVLEQIRERYTLVPLPTRANGGPAERYALAGTDGRVGLIHAMSDPFCDRCNRLRVTSRGRLRSCLLTGGELDLLSEMRAGCSDDHIVSIFSRGADEKPATYEVHAAGLMPMRQLGG